MAGECWKLYYHGLKGRGEFVRLLFEEAGIAYKEISDPKILREELMANKITSYPVFAPPAIQKGDFCLSQTSVICRYLGQKYSMWPTTEEDVWHADQINTTIHDFIAEGRLVFHARGYTESYYTQKKETQGHIDWFKDGRLQRWLRHFETALAANNGGNGFVVGESLTYVDLGLLHVLMAAESQFPDEWKKMDDIPLLKSFRDRIAARPRLASYFKTDRCRPFEGNSMM